MGRERCPVCGETGGLHLFPECLASVPEAHYNHHLAREGLRALLRYIGEDPLREGLVDTPGRVLKAMREMTEGYRQDPRTILAQVFSEQADEMIVVGPIAFSSTCEHHLLPFVGEAHVGYLPAQGRVVGLSKIPRLVHCFARRLQIQERMTREIADAMFLCLEPEGVGVLVRAQHQCLACRGVRDAGSRMTTSAMLGTFRSDASQRAEFLSMIHPTKG